MRASLVAQLVKNPPTMQEILVRLQEDPLEKGQTTHSSTLGLPWWFRWSRIRLQCRRPWVWSLGWKDPLERAWQPTPVFMPGESPWTEGPSGLQSIGSQRIRQDLVTKHTTSHIIRKWLNSVWYCKDRIFCILVCRFNVNLDKDNKVVCVCVWLRSWFKNMFENQAKKIIYIRRTDLEGLHYHTSKIIIKL